MSQPTLLIAGIGNIFLGDDAFGVEVVQQLRERALPECVQVVDFGIRGLDLAYALVDEYEACVLVDAAPRGGAPGDLYVLDIPCGDGGSLADTGLVIDGHGLDPAKVLQLAQAMGGRPKRIVLVGCEPAPLEDYEDIQPGISDAMRSAIPAAVELVIDIADALLNGKSAFDDPAFQIAVGEAVPAAQSNSRNNSSDQESFP